MNGNTPMREAKKYRKKPVVIEAMQFTNENMEEVLQWANGKAIMGYTTEYGDYCIHIATLEGTMTASVGDFIIKGLRGEFYPCKPDVFEKSYEEVQNER